MARGTLNRTIREQVKILTLARTSGGVLGETRATWTPVEPGVLASVQPLGIEDATRLGLDATREQLQLFMAGNYTPAPKRVQVRGVEYQTVKAEAWPSYTRLILERV